jgi:CDP-2,3-bis-(O-geranylgeranyl)-sn-glycerol synthase
VASVLVSALAAPLLGLPWAAGAAAAVAAMAGDLVSSFLKRRMSMPSSSMALGLDQIPEALFPALACRIWLPFSVLDVGAIVLIFLAGELILSRIAYHLNLRDRPY